MVPLKAATERAGGKGPYFDRAWGGKREDMPATKIPNEKVRQLQRGGFWTEIQAALRAGRYRPSPVKVRYIPKADGKAAATGDPDGPGSSDADGGEAGDRADFRGGLPVMQLWIPSEEEPTQALEAFV